MKNKFIYSSVIFSFFFFSYAHIIAQKNIKPVVTVNDIDETFKNWNNLEKPGIAVGVVNDGKIEHLRGYGLANLEYDIPIKTSTKFYIGELSNQFTALSILLLESQGKLSLADDIRKFLPDFPNFKTEISIEDIINHSSGIRDLEVTRSLLGLSNNDIISGNQIDHLFACQKNINATPGQIHQENNSAFLLLERIIEKASGESYEKYIQKNIFDPLQMNNTIFDNGSGELIKEKAIGYYPESDGFVSGFLGQNDSYNTNIFSTIGDMCLWLQNFYHPKVGSVELIERFMSTATLGGIPIEEKMNSLYFNQFRFWNYNGTKKLYHIFVGGGYACKIVHFPDQNMSAVVLGNGGVYNGGMATVTGKLYVKNHFTNSSEPKEIKSISLAKDQLEEYVGKYWEADALYNRSIYLQNDTLMYSRGSFDSPILPIADNKFEMITNSSVYVTFENKEKGKTMIVEAEGQGVFEHLKYKSDADWTKDLDVFVGEYYSEDLDVWYKLALENNKLVIHNFRFGTVELSPILENAFTGNKEYFNELKFNVDNQNGVAGFQLKTYKGDEILFKKVVNQRKRHY